MARKKKKSFRLLSGFAAAAAVLAAAFFGLGGPQEGLYAAFLDVGQADCAIIKCGESALLIDAGDLGQSGIIEEKAEAMGLTRFDFAVASHPHADHIGSLPGILEDMGADTLYMSPYVHTSDVYMRVLESAGENGVDVVLPETGESFMLGQAECVFLNDGSGFDDINNSSLALKITCGDISLLFTGDGEAEYESRLLESGADLSCDILKAPHHGSDTSLSDAFLSACSPDIVVISVGEGNSYGHPSAATLEKLKGREVYRTDEQGDIVFYTDGSEIYPSSLAEAAGGDTGWIFSQAVDILRKGGF